MSGDYGYAKLIQVIEVERICGKGGVGDPVRRFIEYWSADGRLLATRDRWVEEQKTKLDPLLNELIEK